MSLLGQKELHIFNRAYVSILNSAKIVFFTGTLHSSCLVCHPLSTAWMPVCLAPIRFVRALTSKIAFYRSLLLDLDAKKHVPISLKSIITAGLIAVIPLHELVWLRPFPILARMASTVCHVPVKCGHVQTPVTFAGDAAILYFMMNAPPAPLVWPLSPPRCIGGPPILSFPVAPPLQSLVHPFCHRGVPL